MSFEASKHYRFLDKTALESQRFFTVYFKPYYSTIASGVNSIHFLLCFADYEYVILILD
jgi:hypothetical protein